MRKSIWVTTVVLMILSLFVGMTQIVFAQEKEEKPKVKIGIYDSRAVAVAFAGSAIHEKQLKGLNEEIKKAKDSKNTKVAANLENIGKSMQKKMHKQAFSTEPVNDLFFYIPNVLPEIQKAEGFEAIISKWDSENMSKYADADKVDITMKLVDAFKPNEKQRKSAIEIQKSKPLTPEQAEKIKD